MDGLPYKPHKPLDEQAVISGDEQEQESPPPDTTASGPEEEERADEPEAEAEQAEEEPQEPSPDTVEGSTNEALYYERTPINNHGERLCPRCGWDTRYNRHDPFPTNHDRTEFLRTILTNDRFRKQFTLFGGRVRVTFRSLFYEEAEDLSRFVQWVYQKHQDQRIAGLQANRVNMASCIEQIEMFDEDGVQVKNDQWPPLFEQNAPELKNSDEDSGTRSQRVHDYVFKGWSEHLYDAVYEQFTQFDAIYRLLISRSSDPNFYKATPSDT